MNFIGEGKQTQTVLQLRCSAAWASGIHKHLKYLSAFHAFLSITAVLGNILILVALRKVSSLHPPTKLLFRCLATTDLCVGLVAEPLSAVYWMSVADEEWNLCRYVVPSFIITSKRKCCKLHFVFSIFAYSDRNKRGHTSRPVVRAEI